MAEQTATLRFSAVDRASAVVEGIRSKVSSLTGPVDRVRGSLQRLGQTESVQRLSASVGTLRNRFSSLMGVMGAFAGVSGAITGLGLLTKSVAESTEAIGGLSERFQVSSEAIQVYGSLIGAAGGSAESAAKSIAKIGTAMTAALGGDQDARRAFSAIGIGLDQLRTMSKEQVVEKMADAFSKSSNEIAKQNIVLKLMGEQGTFFIDTLNKGADAYRQRLAEMREDGALIDDEDVARAGAFNDMMERLEHVASGLKVDFGLTVAEALLPLMEQLRNLINQNRDRIKAFIETFAARLPDIIVMIGQVGTTIFRVVDVLGGMIGGLVDLFGPVGTAIGGLAIAFSPVIASVISVGAAVAKMVGALVAGIGGIPTAIIAAIGAALVALVRNWDEVIAYLSNSWEEIKSAFSRGILDGVMTSLTELVRGVVNGFVGTIRSTLETIGLSSVMPDWLKNFYMPSTREVAEDKGKATTAQPAPADDSQPAVNAGARIAQAQTVATTTTTESSVHIIVEGNGVRPRVKSAESDGDRLDVTTRTGLAFEGDW